MSMPGRIDPMASSNQREILLGEAASLDDQEYLELMEQLTDFNSSKPRSRLVNELSNHMSKEELSTPEANSFQNRNRKIKQANLKQLKSSPITDQRSVDRCSSLQDLADAASSAASQGSHGRKKASKSKRANSFSADSKSQIKVKSGQNNKRNSKTQPSSPCPPDLSNNSNKKTAKDSNNDHSSTNGNDGVIRTSTTTRYNNNGTIDNYQASSISNHHPKQSCSINTVDCDAQVVFALGDSSSTQPPHSSLSCDHSTVNSTGVTRPQQSTTNYTSTAASAASSNNDETGEGVLESQDYRRRLQLVNVNCLKENQSDTLFKLSNLVAGPLGESNGRSMSGVDKLFDQKDNNDSEIASLTASSNRSSTHQNKANSKKKKKQDVPSQKAENIPGHIGYKDVDFLAQYVIGMDAKLESVTGRGKDKKSSNPTKKRPERSRSQQADLQEKNDTDDDEEEKASSSTHLSPKHSSSLQVEDLTGRHAFSDDEKGYCSDQETGFQVMRSKNRRYNRHDRLPMTKGHIVNKVVPVVSTTSLSKTPSITSATSVSINSRGYDSERECNYLEESVKKKPVRRKSISSVPHSQQNSAENSDVDSSLSLPVASNLTGGSGRISYAQIAKSTLHTNNSHIQQSPCVQGPPLPPPTSAAAAAKQNASVGKRASYGGKSDGEARPSSVNALAAGIVATASEISTTSTCASVCGKSSSTSTNGETCKQPLKTSASCSEITVTCGVEASPSPLLKQNSAPEAKSPVSANLPPVIICGDVKRNANMESDAQFTFGFFDDVIEEDNCCNNSNSSSGNSSASCSPEGNQDKSIVTLASDHHHQDVRLSFNYNEVLAYIRKAWVNSERTMRMQALSASEKSSWA